LLNLFSGDLNSLCRRVWCNLQAGNQAVGDASTRHHPIDKGSVARRLEQEHTRKDRKFQRLGYLTAKPFQYSNIHHHLRLNKACACGFFSLHAAYQA
jgi:hypothetical protein